ncbi:MAG TPA: LuxR C-terminal-related transcriptional regulator [Pyrinomonadaceae bacterium]|jgi:DNA-binding CsgD family transcriptional regulator
METTSEGATALLALSHSPVEQALYEALRAAACGQNASCVGSLSLRRLLELTGLGSYTTLRRARAGLVAKLSIDCKRSASDDGGEEGSGSSYLVYEPEEIFERRRVAGMEPYPKEYRSHARGAGFVSALERVVNGYDLSRREAQVALCCAEGMTNAEIGDKLCISEQTVKFHMRHLFIKFGVRRRGELISRLLRHEDGVVGSGNGAGRQADPLKAQTP